MKLFKALRSKKLPPFVIVGQERSGTTLTQTLLSSHPDTHCRGELFDTWQIDDDGHKNKDIAAIFSRDSAPEEFLTKKLSGEGLQRPRPSVLGFKLLTQHNPKVILEIIPKNPAWRIIHVRRTNKLAQFASRQQVSKSGRWTSCSDIGQAPLIEIEPMWAMAQCNSLKLEDHLLNIFLNTLPNPLLTLDYVSLNRKTTHQTLLDFLDIDPKINLSSPLKKQGQNRISDRFKNANEIEAHFIGSGLGEWLQEEII